MAKAKSKKSKKGKGGSKGNYTRKGGTLSGIGANLKQNFTVKNILDMAMKAGLIVGAIVGGRFIKKKFLKGDQEGIKKFLGPIIELGGGLVLATMKNEKLKFLGYGLIGDAAIEGVNLALNKGKVGTKDILDLDTLKGLLTDGSINALGDSAADPIPLPDYDPHMRGIIELPEEERTFSGQDSEELDSAQII